MKLNKLAPFIALALTTTLAGCNFDGSSSDSGSSSGGSSSGGGDNSGGGTVVETSPLAGGYWEIGSSSEAATLSGVSTYADAVDLPNVYVFDGTTQYYYDDDATPGTYEVKGPTTLTEDIEAGSLSFTYYDASGATPVDGTYSVASGALTIDTAAFGTLSGTNQSSNDVIKSAVNAANENAGIVIGTGETFDDYADGTNISEANPAWIEYNTVGDGNGTSIATVSSEQAKSGSNSLKVSDLEETVNKGEASEVKGNKPYVVRKFINEATLTGEISLDVFIPSSNEKTTYINIGSDKNNDTRYFELRLQADGGIEAEAGSTDIPLEALTLTPDDWNTLSLAWDNDNIVVSVNGIEHTMTQSETKLDSTMTPSQLTIYVGDTDSGGTTAYFDNISSDLF
ncbi:hypothetical protein [Vibrio aphrogenes]|uniref:hypothetical protein n=1 Tax=Vibrio aphrogenes TaxID=1891186 RepID=UPI000B35D00B|nr:hypothetical protein [Vibrio aphrogenes]